ncbi:MAG: zinc-dependent metalloprotease, partial [Actinomycetota bacterium]|nr:zinc-dependent metalloprotease [Actinomycetota bacterium]
MSDFPFGFGPGGGSRGEGGSRGSGGSGGSGSGSSGSGSGGSGSGGPGAGGPGGFGFGAGWPFGGGGIPEDLAGKIPLFAELEKLLSWSGGPVNWDLARQLALRTAAEGGRPALPGEPGAVEQALGIADVWLEEATTLPSGISRSEAWSRDEWIESTVPVWSQLMDPVAASVTEAMGSALPEEVRAQAGPLLGMMGQIGGLVFGAQAGQALGALAREVVSSTDIGLPLGAIGRAALVPAGVAAFAEGLDVPADEVRLYLALREAAHQRLFAHVPWLRDHLFGLVADYARGITIDTSVIERAAGQIDPMNMDPAALQEALGGGLFEPQTTPEQKAALQRLETALALVEGWVDTVVDAAARTHLPAAEALRETVRRRRASGGPAEQAFATLVGLELRPRRLRDAAALWGATREARGIEGRDAVWSSPEA